MAAMFVGPIECQRLRHYAFILPLAAACAWLSKMSLFHVEDVTDNQSHHPRPSPYLGQRWPATPRYDARRDDAGVGLGYQRRTAKAILRFRMYTRGSALRYLHRL